MNPGNVFEDLPASLSVRREATEGGSLAQWADAVPIQVWTALPDGALDYVNRAVVEYFDRPADELIGSGWLSAVHSDDADGTAETWSASLSTGRPYEALFRIRRADGDYRWHIARAVPVLDRDGGILHWFGTNTDIEDRVAAEEGLRRTEARANFLAEASRQLAETIEYEATLRNVARLAVPDFADWCAVDLVAPEGLRRVAVEHPDPKMVDLANRLQERYPPDPDAPTGVYNVIRTGRAEFVEEIPDTLIEAAAVDEEHLRIIRELKLRSYMVVPLATREEVLGAITFVYAESGRSYRDADVSFIQDLARRAATAVDNARLVQRLRDTHTQLEEQSVELEMQTEELRNQAAHLDEQAMELELANEDLRSTVDRLERSEALLAEAQSAAHLGSWEWDIAANVVVWSDELFRLFGLEPQSEVVSFESYLRRVHPDDREVAESRIRRAFADHEPFSFAHRVLTASGEHRYLQSHGRVILDAEGRPARMTGSAQDITEDRAVREAMEAARREAEEANEAKSVFLASMSHELRTPLNAIGGHLELVEMGIHGPVTEEQLRAFERIRANQQHLLGLINDVLQFAKIEAGRLEIGVATVPLADLLRDTMGMLEPQARARGVRYDLQPRPEELFAQGDEERVRQILVNLLSNAIKFTESGGGIVARTDLDGDDVLVQIEDTGRGIPAAMLDAIFDPFVQVGRERHSPQQGVGLGLAISRDLARTMGGDITVASEPGVGSTFTLRLRRSPAS